MDPLDRFEFSQSSLQDFVDCPRRFQLRYLEHVAWPAIQAEPARENERHIQRGQRFHRMVQQYLLGVPEPRLTRLAQADPDEHVLVWWENFLECIPPRLVGQRSVEAGLRAPLGAFRLVAQYDLVLVTGPGCATIFDWKTSLHKPARAWLARRLQSRVYPYLLVRAGAALNGGQPFAPDAIEMIYWFADPAQEPETLVYSAARFQEDGDYLCELVGQIRALDPQRPFATAAGEKACRYCVYRSLCARGGRAAELDGDAPEYDAAQTAGLDFGLEQIGEIAF